MKTLDFLLLEPSLDWEKDLLIKVGMRVEKDIPIRESPRIAAGYMLSVLRSMAIERSSYPWPTKG